MSEIKVEFKVDRPTKNTVRFAEAGDAAKIGTVYIPKSTLSEIGWTEGRGITVTVQLNADDK